MKLKRFPLSKIDSTNTHIKKKSSLKQLHKAIQPASIAVQYRWSRFCRVEMRHKKRFYCTARFGEGTFFCFPFCLPACPTARPCIISFKMCAIVGAIGCSVPGGGGKAGE